MVAGGGNGVADILGVANGVDEAAGGILTLGADPIDIRRIRRQNRLDGLATVLPLRKDLLPILQRQKTIQRDEIELGTLYLLLALAALALRTEHINGGTHICQRIVRPIEIVPIVAPIDIAQTAGSAGRLDNISIVEGMAVEIERQALALQIVVQDTGIEAVAIVRKHIAALDKRHHLRIDRAKADPIRLKLLAGNMMHRLCRRRNAIRTGRANIPITMIYLNEIGGTELDKRQLDDPIVLDLQAGSFGIKANNELGHGMTISN